MVTIEAQGFSYVQYVADGVAVNFTIIAPYLLEEDIHVFLDGVETADWSFLNASEIQMDVAPANLALLTIKRTTAQDERLVDFEDGGQLREATLDLDSNQMFYLCQEAIDTTDFNLAINSTDSTIDARNNKVINLAEGTDPTDAVNKAQLDVVDAAAAAAVVTANAAEATANAIAATANTALAQSASAIAAAAAAQATADAAVVTANAADATANAIAATAAQGVADAATANAAIATHISNPAGAHVGTAISIAPSGNLAATTAQAAVVELQLDVDTRALASDLTTHTGASTQVHGLTVGSSVVGTLDAQTLTSKIITGADVRTPIRSDVKQDTHANLITYAASATNGQLCWGTDDKKLYEVKDSAIVEVGSGTGSGGINHVLNGTFESDANAAQPSGWVTYNDGSAAAPVDGTGGSVTTTFLASTTTPLRGLSSAVLTKDAADRRGEGAAYPFTIDKGDRCKINLISFDYETSANYVDGDVRIYIINDTSLEVKELAVRDLAANTTGTYTAFFQADGTDSYRLCIHVATVSALAYTIKMDNFNIGPQLIVRGAIDVYLGTLPTTGTWTTNTTYDFNYWRIGHWLIAKGRVATSGAPDAVALKVNLPSGLHIDTTALPNGLTINDVSHGNGNIDDSGGSYYGLTVRGDGTDTAFRIQCQTLADPRTPNNNVSNTTPMTWGAGDNAYIEYRVPIAGWSSNMVLSEDAGNRQIASKAGRLTDQTIASTSETKVALNSVTTTATLDLYDTTSSFDIANNRFIAPEAGKYSGVAFVSISNLTAADNVILSIKKNNTIYVALTENSTNNTSRYISLPFEVGMIKGDYLELYVNSSADSSYTINSNLSHFATHKLSNPQTVASVETVACCYESDAAQSITNNATTTLSFEDKVFDTHNAWSSNNTFTAPYAGLYWIYSKVHFAASTTWGQGEYARLDTNFSAGNNNINNYYYPPAAGIPAQVGVHSGKLCRLNKGDTVYFAVGQTSGGTRALNGVASDNSIMIFRVGN